MVVPTVPKTSEEVTGNLELLFEKNIQLSQEFFGQFEEHKILMVLPCALCLVLAACVSFKEKAHVYLRTTGRKFHSSLLYKYLIEAQMPTIALMYPGLLFPIQCIASPKIIYSFSQSLCEIGLLMLS